MVTIGEDDTTFKRSQNDNMADEINGEELALQSTPSAEGSEEVQVDDQVQDVNEEQNPQPEASSDNQENEEKSSDGTGEQSGQEAKPTRVERRIHDLLSKVKEVSNTPTSQPPVNNDNPLFTEQDKQDLENGYIDPETLMQKVQSTVQSEVQKAIQIDRITQQYNSEVQAHAQDLESVKDIDPDLEAEAVAEYEAVNYQVNPFTGEREFVPAVKLSEIVAKIESRAQKIATKMAEKIAEGNVRHLQEVSSSQAVPTNGSVGGSISVAPDTTDFSAFEKAYSSK